MKILKAYLTVVAAIMSVNGTGILHAQNLVPNPGFESNTACPVFASQLNLAAPWYNPTGATPEYFNACADYNSWVSVPSTPSGGYQPAHGGDAYAGIFVFRNDVANMREYLQIELSEPLEADVCYYYEMFVSPANDHRFAVNRLGAHFSNGSLGTPGVGLINVTPQVESTNVFLSDTSRWVRISGYFTATGNEDHLTIGNFRSDELTSSVEVNPGAWYNGSAYLLIDDVSLVKAAFTASLGPELYCNTESVELDVTQFETEYLWASGETTPNITISESGHYSVTLSRGGCTIILQSDIQLLQTPRPDLYDTTICNGAEIKLSPGGPEGDYLWSTGATAETITTAEAGKYWVQVSNECGVRADTMTLGLFECSCDVFLPAAFTPNKDLVNDDYFIGVDCPKMTNFNFMVFNRIGELVYASDNPDSRWDGTYKGRECPAGVYPYTLKYYTLTKGEVRQQDFQGKIHLIR
ncbi:MAG: gliding motility-associated C-terminal domain-containing protein [Bacteroidia bacterium]